jgi:hypothetical protein
VDASGRNELYNNWTHTYVASTASLFKLVHVRRLATESLQFSCTIEGQTLILCVNFSKMAMYIRSVSHRCVYKELEQLTFRSQANINSELLPASIPMD